jgi:hypothetical protein
VVGERGKVDERREWARKKDIYRKRSMSALYIKGMLNLYVFIRMCRQVINNKKNQRNNKV